jgi:hypothetical protein
MKKEKTENKAIMVETVEKPMFRQPVGRLKLFSDKVKYEFQEMCLRSTAHGVANIIRSEHLFMKCIWIIFFLTFSCLASGLIAMSIVDYLEYGVHTNIQVINAIPTDFPAVTICKKTCLFEKLSISLSLTSVILTKEKVKGTIQLK